jgi:formylglycine-generating enzyme required for sulfatase activity
VRRVIEDLLRQVLTKPGEAISLEVVAPREVQAQGWWRLTAELQQWRQRRELRRLLQAHPEESPLRDYVFLNFLAGKRPPRLSVPAPELWQQLLFTKGQSVLGVRAITAGVAALAAGLVLLSVPFYFLAYLVLVLVASVALPASGVLTWAITDLFIQAVGLPDDAPAVSPETPYSPSANELPTPTSETAVVATPPAQDVSAALPDTLPAFEVAQTAAGHRVKLSYEVELELVDLPGGEFTMGGERYDDEQPKHQVHVASFVIGKYLVTQAQWRAVMGNNPSFFKGEDLPVEWVSWEDAVRFCERLSQLTGVQFRLPTEAEWEYACRAGTTTEYCFCDDEKQLGDYAWYRSNSGNQTHPVGQKLPNKFGLYDMHGNVWEWCQDLWHRNYQGAPTDGSGQLSSGGSSLQAQRGGAWNDNSDNCRLANRNNNEPGDRNNNIGFRVVVSTSTLHGQSRRKRLRRAHTKSPVRRPARRVTASENQPSLSGLVGCEVRRSAQAPLNCQPYLPIFDVTSTSRLLTRAVLSFLPLHAT